MRVIVTGGSGGIGRAIADTLIAADIEVAVCASSAAPLVPGAFHSARCDVSDEYQVRQFFEEVRTYGTTDGVVLNAGVLERAPIEQFSAAQFDRVIGVNLRGAFLCAREAFRAGAKRIVAIGSISGTLGTPHAAAYNASKWGLTGLMKSLAEEGRERGIFCATVLPSGVDTEMLRKTPFPPMVTAADVARVVKYLCTEAPFAMTGCALEVFG
jgi:NAD(P)-dependent dehydrogenase (short-subunit alcohol dehydrogenase family)